MIFAPCRPAAPLRAATGVILIALGSTSPSMAHEPLWGETSNIFGPGVFHPEIRLGMMHRGDTSDPGGESAREFEQEYGLQYGVNRFVNVRLDLPAVRTDMEENISGTTQSAAVNGIGDLLLSAKVRFHLRQDTGFQTSQAVALAWKLPTGDDDLSGPGGERLIPSDQPGSGQHGFEVGYAIDW